MTVGGDSLASIRNTQVKMSHYCGQGFVDNVTILMAPIRLQYLLHVVCVLGKVHVHVSHKDRYSVALSGKVTWQGGRGGEGEGCEEGRG